MSSTLILVVLLYLLYSFVDQLLEAYRSGDPFALIHWVMLGVCVIILPLIVFMGIRAWKDNKKQRAERAQEESKQREELAKRRRARYTMDDEEFDENYDALDALPPAADITDSAAGPDESDSDPGDTVQDDTSATTPPAKSKYDE